MAPARGGRLVRLANLRRLPLKHLHPELEVPDLIHNPLRRAAANDDGFRVVGQAHHDQRVPGAQRRSLVRVLDLRGGEAWEVSVRALWALAPAAAAKALQQSIAAHACPGGYGSPLKQHSHPSSAIRGCPPPRAWPARSLGALLCSTGPVPFNPRPTIHHTGRTAPRAHGKGSSPPSLSLNGKRSLVQQLDH